MNTLLFNGYHKKVAEVIKKQGFIFNKDFSYSGTLRDSSIGKKAKNYITFYNDKAKDFYFKKYL